MRSKDNAPIVELGGEEMPDVVIVALISLAGTLFGSIAGIMTANKLTTYRIGELENKVEKFNNLVERMFKVEQNTARQWDRIDEIKTDIAEIKATIQRGE